jgi:surfeit locus 1 family protein
LRIEGVVLSHLPRTLKLDGPAKGPVRQSVELEEFAAESGLTLQAFFIQQHSDSGDGLARDWPPPDAGIEKHQAYSIQWYSLATLAVVLALVLSFRRA